MPTVVKQTKIRIAGPAMTNRRWTQYANTAIDGVVATATDNTSPTKAQMAAIEKAYYRYQRLCAELGGLGVVVDDILTDTSAIGTIPTSIELLVSYRPNAVVAQASTFDSAKLGVTAKSGSMPGEIEAIGVAVLNALGKAFDGATELAQTFRGNAIEVIQVPAPADNTVGKAYNVIQLGSAEITLDGFVTKITVTEF